MTESRLNLALIHPELDHGQARTNRDRLISLIEKAAGDGAKVIATTEMAVSGYSFESRSQIAPLVETDQGPTLTALAKLAADRGIYICLGLAEVDPADGLYYNSAFILAPDGRRARRRKISAESKWACPGPRSQADVLDTPWGRLGTLICSETYYGLTVRSMALKGVDLLLVPANWPPAGLDPRKLWQARAMENGLYLAAANRTGRDLKMDCTPARSVLVDPNGRVIDQGGGDCSRIIHSALPLVNGRLDNTIRLARLAGRTPEKYQYLGADLGMVQNLTAFFELPPLGKLALSVRAGAPSKNLDGLPALPAGLTVLPRLDDRICLPGRLPDWAGQTNGAVCAQLGQGDSCRLVLAEPGRLHLFNPAELAEPALVDLGPARLGLVTAEAARHPETAAVLVKRGCDAMVVSGGELTDEDQAILAVKAVEKLALIGAFRNRALVSLPPAGHQPWGQTQSEAPGAIEMELDVEPLRRRTYQDRFDLKTLLAPTGPAQP